MHKLCKSGGFVGFSVKKDGALTEFILNNGFVDGVVKSENYHFHSSYEVHVCVRGTLHILVEEKDIFLFAGDIAVIAPGAVHYVFAECDSYRVSYRFKLSRTAEGAVFPFLSDAYSKVGSISVIKEFDIYEKYLCPAGESFRKSRPEFFVSEPLFLATYEIAERICGSSFGGGDVKSTNSLLAEEIEEFFNAHYSSSVTLGDLASHLNFSSRHTERIMHRIFGISFGEMLNRKRLGAARLLLRISDNPVSEIGEAVGFCDSNYFNRKFSDAFGVSAVKYRESCQQE